MLGKLLESLPVFAHFIGNMKTHSAEWLPPPLDSYIGTHPPRDSHRLHGLALIVLGDHGGTLAQLHINQVQHGAEEWPFLATAREDPYRCDVQVESEIS